MRPRPDRLLRIPIGDDIVVDLILRWDLHKLHAAFTPIARWLNP